VEPIRSSIHRSAAPVLLAAAALSAATPLLAPGSARAAGFAIYEQGVAATANGGAMTARASDPSAVYFNPAAIVGHPGVQTMLGTTAILLRNGWYRDPVAGVRYDQADNVTFPSYLYVTQRVSPRWGWGVGLNTPSGLKTEWGATFPGRFISLESSVEVISASVNLAAALGRGWSLAAGFDYSHADVKTLTRNIDLAPLGAAGQEGLATLSGDGNDVGWNAAVRWEGTGWRWGGTYRSGMSPGIDGMIEFSDIPASLVPLFPDGGATSVLPLPAMAATGVARVWDSGWEAEADVVWTRWSAFEVLEIDLEKTTSYLGVPVVSDSRQVEDWADVFSFRFGAARRVSNRDVLRFGAYYDRTPVSANHMRPRLPDANRTSVQIGYGYGGPQGLFLDATYQAIFFADRTATGDPADPTNPVLSGTYGNFLSRIGLGVGWRF
jgi:long-chain fatty acid transport protein